MEGPWQRSANVPAGSQALRIVTKGKENGTFPEEKASGDVGSSEQSAVVAVLWGPVRRRDWA